MTARDSKRVYGEYLVLSAQAGSRADFARLAALWQPALGRYALRVTGDADMAADALQDAWLDIVKGLPRLHDAAAFPAWAYRIVTRKCAARIRGRQRQRAGQTALAAEPVVHSVDGAGLAESRADLGAIAAAMTALPDDQRAAIALHYRDGLSVAEIAVALACPAGTVKTRLMHARRRLQAALSAKPEGGFDDQN